jgi:hypothetical protein
MVAKKNAEQEMGIRRRVCETEQMFVLVHFKV